MPTFKVIEPTEKCDDPIWYPILESEFEVQAYIYQRLKERGFDVRGEVSSKSRTCKFDLVVFDDRVPAVIIEVKKKRKKTRREFRHFKDQKSRYAKFGVKLVCCTGMRQAIALCDVFNLWIENPPK